ncbi:AI-2E family transporter [Marinitoga aeolica]|uniref:AI-2E family transporter n=1 Tax=Marinitoga aeolica TaxID=2809031 RepID=A0ABY8PNP5_9BACT|nr:AI-2E family transporter [Marinitoga aeolica]WGS64242.1 AI-2E family transporter [Marinitoga aeolica]
MKLSPNLKGALFSALYFLLFISITFISRDVFTIIIFTIGFVLAINLIAKGLNKLKIPMKIATIFSLISSLFFLYLLLVLLIPTVIREISNFVVFLNDFFQKGSWKILLKNQPENIVNNIENFMNSLQPKLIEMLSNFIELIPSYGQKAFTFLFFLTIGSIYLSFYFEQFKEKLQYLYPKSLRNSAKIFYDESFNQIEHYVVATLFASAFVGVSAFLAMSFLGIKYQLLLSFWAAVTNFIPVIGVVLEFIPMIVVGISSGLTTMLLFLLIMSIIHGIAFIIFISIMKDYGRINPVITIFSLLILGSIISLTGALIAVPTAMIIKVFWQIYIKPELERS